MSCLLHKCMVIYIYSRLFLFIFYVIIPYNQHETEVASIFSSLLSLSYELNGFLIDFFLFFSLKIKMARYLKTMMCMDKFMVTLNSSDVLLKRCLFDDITGCSK